MGDPTNMLDYNYKFITFATRKFLPSLNIWLKSTIMHRDFLCQSQEQKATICVYLGHDIDDSVTQSLKSSYTGVEFIHLPTQVPNGAFGDYWAPEHYAWKIWIYNQLALSRGEERPTIAIYFDAGIVMTRLPEVMINKTIEAGLCFIEDNTQKNKFWCSENFCEIVKPTAEELEANQILAGICTLKIGSAAAKIFFNEAYQLSLNRQVIVGTKWEGLMPTGQPFGHRHDQSILSILRLRHSVPTVMIDDTQTADCLRTARITNKAFYIHRGQFHISKEILPKITDAYVINLDRRRDRYDQFIANHGEFARRVRRVSAVDGRQLKLTPSIARLLRPNDFFWKKAIAGCALSHLQIWNQLAHEPGDVNSYLIMEDDVKMVEGWQRQWRMASQVVPENWDVLYLGGVLPPNKPGLEGIKERVNEHWCRVAPNQMFNQPYPTRYFHFCNYAYVLSRRGAQKLLGLIEGRDGFYTSGDHMIVNNHQILNIYFCDPLIAGCTQENDPAYMKSAFNDFGRTDSFDSDLWNNDERWAVEEREISADQNLDIGAALKDLSAPKAVQLASISVKGPPIMIHAPIISIPPPPLTVYMINPSVESATVMELDWLEEIFERQINIVRMPEKSSQFKPGELVWVTVSRQDLHIWLNIFKIFEVEKRPYKVIHLSDEFGKDDISWYKSPMCKGVVRMYNRPDAVGPNIITIPLGYSDKLGPKKYDLQAEREYKWSFYGTAWFDRPAKLAALSKIGPNKIKLFDNWNHPDLEPRPKYFDTLTKSVFVPCPQGNNAETFRFCEALEAGAIPVYVRSTNGDRSQGEGDFWKWIQENVPMIEFKSWPQAVAAMEFLIANPEHLIKYRDGILGKYKEMKKKYQKLVNTII